MAPFPNKAYRVAFARHHLGQIQKKRFRHIEPQSKGSNPRPGSTVQIRSIAVYRSTFGIVLDTSGYDAGQCDPDCPPTYAAIQKWIVDHHGVKVSKSSVTMVKDKCGALKLDFKAGKEPDSGIIKTAKERLVLEAFRAFGVV